MKNRMASRKKKSRSFNPGHEELSKAIAEFVDHGGHIQQITATDTNLDEFLSHKDERSVDEFLMGGNFSMDATRF